MIYLKFVKDVINLIISHNVVAIIAILNRKRCDNARTGDSDEKDKRNEIEIGIVNGHQVLPAHALDVPVQGQPGYQDLRQNHKDNHNHNLGHVQDQETEIDIVHPR